MVPFSSHKTTGFDTSERVNTVNSVNGSSTLEGMLAELMISPVEGEMEVTWMVYEAVDLAIPTANRAS